jgi:hypothetical protein
MRHGGLQAVKGRERKREGQGVVEVRRAGPGSEVPAENLGTSGAGEGEL